MVKSQLLDITNYLEVHSMFGCIYKITNLIDGKIYVGRYKYGRYPTFENYWGSGPYLKRAIAKYGLENFKKEVLQEAKDNEELNKLEITWIEQLHAIEVGYNLNAGGDCGTTSAEVGRKISETKKGHSPSKYKGVPRSDEVRKKISEGRKGINTITPEIREKMVVSLRKRREEGRSALSEETIEKIRQKKIERDALRTEPVVVSEETRKKLSKANKGKRKPPRSAEHSQHQSEAKKGKPWSEARRAAQARKNKGEEIAPENPDTQGE